MSNINFEQDKTDVLDKSENLKLLSNEVQKMESLVSEISGIEDKLKQRKKDLDHLSGEIIPTMIIRDIPLPIPLSVILSPSHMRNKVPVTILIIPVKVNIIPGLFTTCCPFDVRLGKKTATTP